MKTQLKTLCILIAVLAMSVNSVLVTTDENILRKLVSDYMNAPNKHLFKFYHLLYQKPYELESEEGLKRFQIFQENIQYINERNAKKDTFELGVGPFTDMTHEEFREGFIKKNVFEGENIVNVGTESNQSFGVSAFTEYDWRPHINNSKPHQLYCGSCYAFSSLTTLEAHQSIRYGKNPRFSVQDIVDCDMTNRGCNGGVQGKVYKHIIKNGIALEADYPYESGRDKVRKQCRSNVRRYFPVKSYTSCVASCNREYTLRYLARGPLAVNMDAGFRDFEHYSGNMLDERNFSCTNEADHGVVLTSIKIDPTDGRPYYIVKNSWSDKWGDNGYFKIKLNDIGKTCLIEDGFYVPEIRDWQQPPPVEVVFPRVYNNCGYAGEYAELRENMPLIPDKWSTILSYELGSFDKMTVFSESNCSGKILESSSSNICLASPTSQFPVVKSVVVHVPVPPEGCVWFFEYPCLSGRRIELCDSKFGLDFTAGSVALGSKVKSLLIMNDKSGGGITSTSFNIIKYASPKIISIKIDK